MAKKKESYSKDELERLKAIAKSCGVTLVYTKSKFQECLKRNNIQNNEYLPTEEDRRLYCFLGLIAIIQDEKNGGTKN